MTRDLVSEDVDEIVGASYESDRLVDVEAVSCNTCGALVRSDSSPRWRHAEWHVKQGHYTFPRER
jgi:hypothetical protein